MTDKQEPLPFKDAVPRAPQEPDRLLIDRELNIIITGIVISTETRYEKIAKINGLVDGQPTKWATTGKVIIKHCEEIIANVGTSGGQLKRAVSARIYYRTSDAGTKYLDME